jgi:hypothetical protein
MAADDRDGVARSRAAMGAVGVPANSEQTGPSKSISK